MRLLLDTHAFLWALDGYASHLAVLRAEELPITSEHALKASGFVIEHRDPFDRMLAAQAILEGVRWWTGACEPMADAHWKVVRVCKLAAPRVQLAERKGRMCQCGRRGTRKPGNSAGMCSLIVELERVD